MAQPFAGGIHYHSAGTVGDGVAILGLMQQHCFVNAVDLGEFANGGLRWIWLQFRLGANFESPKRMGIDDEEVAVRIVRQVLVLLPIRGDRALKLPVVIYEVSDRCRLRSTMAVDRGERGGEGCVQQISVTFWRHIQDVWH